MNESKTPRTDAKLCVSRHPDDLLGWPNGRKVTFDDNYIVPADFARQLETELADMTESRDAWKASHDNQVKLKAALMDRPDLRDRARRVTALADELTASKALSTTLADALDFIAKWNLPKNYELDFGSNGAREYIKGVAERALEAWRAAE